MKPLNSVLRFILEIAALMTFGIWGYHLSDTGMRIAWALLLPLGFALIWGVFAVRDDPSRSGKTVVNTPGWIRLLLELGLFFAAAWMLYDLGYTILLWIYAAALFIHYLLAYKRIGWLLKQ